MNIQETVRELGAVDIAPLIQTIDALPDTAWREETHRQEEYDVHKATLSIVMLFCDLNAWPELKVNRERGWELLREPALPLMDSLIARCFVPQGQVIRAMVAGLPASARITPHRDVHESFHTSHRVHVPLITNPRVRFTVDGVPYRFEPGQAYEINNQKPHSVMNNGDTTRVHLIFDYLPPRSSGA